MATVVKNLSLAWSVADARTINEDNRFQCPLRTHRGIDSTTGATYWIPLYDKSARCSRGPLINDAFNRYYWTQDGQNLRYDTLANLRLDTRTTGIEVGVPPPANTPSVSVVGGDSDLIVDRAYVYTYVSIYGEEGPPSDAKLVSGSSDGVWTISNMSVGPEDADVRKITKKNIYRSISFFGDANFFYVATVPIGSTSYIDSKSTEEVSLNSTLESTSFFPPPEGLSGLTAHPNGFFVGFVGRNIYFSEPYRPHAWPPEYTLSTLGDIIGLGVFDTTIVIGTNGHPYTATGIVPNGIILTKHDTAEPCIGRYGIVSMPFGVYYPSPNGLMLVSPNGFTNATKALMTKEDWQARYKVRDFDAARYQYQYVAFYTPTNGVMFDPQEPTAALVDLNLSSTGSVLDRQDSIFTDEYSGRTFIISNCSMYEWNPLSGINTRLDWTSLEFDLADPVNMGAARIIWYATWETPTPEQIAAWRLWNIARIEDAPLNPLNFNALNVVRQEDPVGFEDFIESKQPFHWSPLIWVPPVGEAWPNSPQVIMDLVVDGRVVYTKEVTHTNMFRLPSGFKGTMFKIRIRANVNIKSCKISETGKELSRV